MQGQKRGEVVFEGGVGWLVRVVGGGGGVVVGGGGRVVEELEAEAAGDVAEVGEGGGEGGELRAGMLLGSEALGRILVDVVQHGPRTGDAGHEATPGVQGVLARDLCEQVLRNVEIVREGPVLAVAVVLRVRLDEQEDRAADAVRALQHAGGGAVLYMAGPARAGACWRVLAKAGTAEMMKAATALFNKHFYINDSSAARLQGTQRQSWSCGPAVCAAERSAG